MFTVDLPLASRGALLHRYQESLPTFEGIMAEVRRAMEQVLVARDLRVTLRARVKSFESLYAKLIRLGRKSGADAVSARGPAGTVSAYDIVALRIVCPFLEDVARAEAGIREVFSVEEIERKGSHYSVREFGYESVHCLIRLPDEMTRRFLLAEDFACEVQIRTILQEAWAEVEHELVYKATATPFDETLKRKLAALNANLTLADITFQEIRDYQRRLQVQLQQRRDDFWTLVSRATGTGEAVGDSSDGPVGPPRPPAHHQDRETLTFGISVEDVPGAPGPAGLDGLLLEALAAHNEGRLAHADAVYTRILEASPRPPVRAIVLLHRGLSRVAAGRYSDALSDIDAALAVDPSNLRGRYYRAVVLQITGRLDEAERLFSDCLRTDPYFVDCLLQRARLRRSRDQIAEARSDVARALEIAPESPVAKAMQAELERTRPQAQPG